MNLIPYAGRQYGLQFPVMCNGYISVDYSDNVATENRGIWDHEGSFSLEVLFTPYDVNGYGSNSTDATTSGSRPLGKCANGGFGNQTSQKTMPAKATNISGASEDITYMTLPNRLTHRMCLFSSTNLKLYLINDTTTTVNQPAEYYIEVQLTTGAASTSTVRTPKLFKSRTTHSMSHGDPLNLSYSNNDVKYIKTGFTGTVGSSASRLRVADSDSGLNQLRLDNDFSLFKSDGTLIGIIQSVGVIGSSDIQFNMDRDITSAVPSSTDIYIEAPKEITYPLSAHHVGVSYSKASNSINIFHNGSKVATGKHTDTNTFSFGNADITLGQDRTDSAKRYSQFMGELHEVAVLRGAKQSMNTTTTLLPQYNDTLLYIDFEEADI